ncbi:MAG: YafY family transcriptional regulator [Lachnospiraceae bacterium]|nr:YafY family transcriptional regulator [Lachnospiraceae bacterium]
MKLERLYAITVYLLNHGRTSASNLAKHFEVSTRTIQRDIDSLCVSGIPVIAVNGINGGYEISDRFRIDRELSTSDEYSLILTALRGLVSATENEKAKNTLEKLSHAANPDDTGIILDFSVLREGDYTILQQLQAAVTQKQTVRFTYTNNNNETRVHHVEPIAVLYRWYAWYLLAYSRVRDDYRTYKLIRMSNLEVTDETFLREHEPADVIFQKTNKKDSREYTDVLLRCKQAAKTRAIEYLKGTVTEELPGGDVLIKTCVVENEQFWFGALLSLGDDIEVVEPDTIRQRAIQTAKKILELYGEL